MARRYYLAQGNYLADFEDLPGLQANFDDYPFRLYIPPDLDETAVAAIATAAGLEPRGEDSGCGGGFEGFATRRIQICRTGGGNISVPIINMAATITLANAIVDATPDVVAVNLIGEQWGELVDVANPAKTAAVPGPVSRPSTGTKQTVFSGRYLYQFDEAVNPVLIYKIDSEDPAAPPAIVSPTYATCAGSPIFSACGTLSGQISHRRITGQFLTGDDDGDGGFENIASTVKEIPITSRSRAEIRDCIVSASNLPALECLSYAGTSMRRFDRYLTT